MLWVIEDAAWERFFIFFLTVCDPFSCHLLKKGSTYSLPFLAGFVGDEQLTSLQSLNSSSSCAVYND